MGVSERFSIAFAKSQLAAGVDFPTSGTIFISVSSRHKDKIEDLARRLIKLGFDLIATQGTAERLESSGVPVRRVRKLAEGHPNLIDHLKNGEVVLIINTPSGKGARTDEGRIRSTAVQQGVPCITTLPAAEAAVTAMEALREEGMEVEALQDRFGNKPTMYRVSTIIES